ncbi:MAG: glycosyltransferase [Telluria sp.]
MRQPPYSIAFIVRDPLPPTRADVLTLFGTELPRYGIASELIGQAGNDAPQPWRAGGMHVAGKLSGRFASVLSAWWDLRALWRVCRRARPDCIQVRDKIASGLVGRIAAAVLRVPFVYWMSFPIVEGFEVRRDDLKKSGSRSWPLHALRAALSRFVIYKLVLPGARHIFVQSDAMAAWLAAKGFDRARMTPVPMGVDAALFDRARIEPVADPRLDGRRVVLYLGRVARARKSDFLFDVADHLRAAMPESLLVIAGDAPSNDEMDWMRRELDRRGLADHVLLTGWLPQKTALGYAVRAEVGLSPIPRGTLFDVSSPTKLVEYLALGIPSVANDIPDQQLVIEQSRAGLCVPMDAAAFAEATLRLLRGRKLAAAFSARGPAWVRSHRTYDILGKTVAQAYEQLRTRKPATPMWRYSLRFSLRSLGRELGRNLWARLFVYPALARNERDPQALAIYRTTRAGRLGVQVDPDGRQLRFLAHGDKPLAKADVRQHPERFVRPRRPGALLRTTIRTSGTTGSPLTLVQTLGSTVREEAFVHRQLRWIGLRHGQRRAWIRGDLVCDDHPPDGRFWCHDWVGNALMMSSYHLSGDAIPRYVDALERFDPVVIQAYPSSVGTLAAWMNAHGRRYQGRGLKAVMTSSETLEPAVRAAIETAFGVQVIDWYGQAERVAAIGTCEHGRYHVLTDYGGVRLLARPDGSAELIGTSLNNPAMPLQDYATGDTVIPDGQPCPCGRVFPTVKAVIGRQERTVTLPDGRQVTRLDRVFQGHDRALVEGQVCYLGDGRFVLRVVPTSRFDAADEAALVDKFLLRVPGADVTVEKVDAIPRGPNGKFEFIALDV